jgi:hypothetical protein
VYVSVTSLELSSRNAVPVLTCRPRFARAVRFDRLILAAIDSSKNFTSGSSELSLRSSMKRSNICVLRNRRMNWILIADVGILAMKSSALNDT